MAFLASRKRGGRVRWFIVWADATKGASKAGRREADCENGDHAEAMDAADLTGDAREALALGATSKALRKALVACYEALERAKAREAARLGGRQAKHETPLVDLVDGYLALVAYREALRTAPKGSRPPLPETSAWWRPAKRERPMTASTADDLRRDLARFRAFAEARRLTTGDLVAEVLAGYLGSVLDRGVKARTHNKHRAVLRAMFAALTREAARSLFRVDALELFRDGVEPLPASRAEIVVYPVEALAAFLEVAERFGEPGRLLDVRREKAGRVETFRQANSSPPSPVLEAALVLLCTGTRRGEGLALRWRDVDLEKGIVKVRSTKTSTIRYVPLAGDPAGDIAPRFLELLRAWREADPARETVLPRNGESGPAFTRAWARVAKAAGVDVGPQGLRRTFESVLASVGVPSTLSAFWLGHAPAVAYRHYLAYAPGRLPGRTVEAVLGLVPFLERALERARKGKAFRVVGSGTA